MEIVIKTLEGLEEVLAEELHHLHLSNIKILKRAVSCEGNWSQLYKCNYNLRTALRVLMPIEKAPMQTQEDLYDIVYNIDWAEYMKPKNTFAINTTLSGDLFNNSQFVTYRVKDAIVDRMVDNLDVRPNVDTKKPDFVIDIHISHENHLTISLDSSGASLHLRNYKQRQYRAPLNEVLAAGILKLSGYDGSQDLIDPMCGSGTLLTEALMISANIPAGKFIKRFAFQNWNNYKKDLFKTILKNENEKISKPLSKIHGYDINDAALRDTRKNLQNFVHKDTIRLTQSNFFRGTGESNKLLIMNPPYDIRITNYDINSFYKEIGNTLKRNWGGSTAWLITANLEAMKSFGLKPSRKISLFNGGLASKLFKFDLYDGSKKQKYN